MTGLPTDILQQLRQTLLECEEVLGSNGRLRDLFTDETISPFRTGLPERDSVTARVEALIAHLSNKRLADGRSALPLFLHVLSHRYHPTDHRHLTLQSLATHLSSSPLPPHPPAPSPSWNTTAIRNLLTAALNDQGLTDLTFDEFPAVYAEFSDGLTRGRKIQLLLDYCQRHEQMEQLLQHIQRLNLHQYRQHQPYVIRDT